MSIFLWHGAIMAVAWLVLVPAGALVARFYKVRPGQDFPRELDDRFWWDTHRILQSVATGLAGFAVWLAYDAMGGVDWAVPHVQIGVVTLSLLAAQMVSPLLRGSKGGPTSEFADPADPLTWRGDHYDMTVQRRVFEAWHKNFGYVAMACAIAALWTGIDLAGLQAWWKWAIVAMVAISTTLFVRLSRQHRRTDTWLAIWGPDGR